MLIVGDYPYKLSVDADTEVNGIEVIVSPENKEKLLKELDLQGEKAVSISKDIELYNVKDKKYIIFTANTAYLSLLIRANYATTRLKVATPAINYAFLWYMNRLRFYDVTTWLRISIQIKKLKPYFYKSYITRSGQYKLLTCGEKLARNYFCNVAYITPPYEPIGFVKYDKYDMLIAMGCAFQSPYKKITIPGPSTTFFNDRIFAAFSTFEKNVAVLEMIYLHALTEYFIPENEANNIFPFMLKWKEIFIQSMMDISTAKTSNFEFIKDYILDNTEELLSHYRPNMFVNYITSEREKKLTPLKSWETNGKT